jgi:hypothetical protein
MAFLLLPSLPLVLLFGVKSQAVFTLVLGRFGGAALLCLSITCWLVAENAAAAAVIKVMLLYDVIAITLLGYVRGSLGLSGVFLWPAVAIHISLAVWSCVVILDSVS